MSLRVTCPECGSSHSVSEDQRGRKVRCKECDAAIRVPTKGRSSARDDEDDEDEIQDDRPRKKAAAAGKAKPQRRRDDDYDEDDEEEPRGRKKEKKGSSGMVLVLVGVLAVLGVAAGGAYFALREDDKGKNVAKDNTPPPGGTQPPPGPGPVVNPPADTGKGPAKDPPKDPPGGNPPAVSAGSVYQYVLKSVAWIITRQADGVAMGSGSLIDRDNRLVLTNYHVVHGQLDFVVFFPVYKDGHLISERTIYIQQAKREDAIKGKVVAHDKTRDLALIQLDRVPDGIEALPFAKAEPKQGDHLHSVGNPGGSGALWVYTPGQVRSVYRKQWIAGGEDFELKLDARVVESTSPTNPGDSGGPCVNDRGELVGVTQGGSRVANSISFFIERSEAEDFINKTFTGADPLRGKQWVRAQRASLADSGGGAAVNLPALRKKLLSPDPQVRAEGAQGLQLLGPGARPALPELVTALGDKDAFVRRLAASALRQIGTPLPDDLPDLLPALESSVPEAKIYVLEALVTLGGHAKAAPLVLQATEESDAKVRQQAMRALGKMVTAAGEREARAAMEKGLQDSDKGVRSAAAEALTTSIPQVANDVPKLQELLKHKEVEVRVQAAKALGRLGDKAKPASPALVAALREDDRELRRSVFYALKAVGADPKELLPELRRGLKDSDTEVRRAALEAAGKAGADAKELVPAIAEALADADVRKAALSALAQIGPDGAKDAAGKVASLPETDKTTRKEAVAALAAMKVSGPTAQLVAPKLIAVFEDEKDKDVRDKVADTLGRLGKPALLPLTQALRNPSAAVRGGSATALGAMGGEAKGAITELANAIARETNPTAREEEVAALRSIQAAPPPK